MVSLFFILSFLILSVVSANECVDDASCNPGEKCINGICDQRITIDPCEFNPDLCPEGTLCLSGECIDPCATIRCKFGYQCVNGECIEQEPIDPCATIRCAFGYRCIDGKCIPEDEITNPCSKVSCPKGKTCIYGECRYSNYYPIDPCSNIVCKPGYQCIDGNCIDEDCINILCPDGTDCINGECIERDCATILCPSGSKCVDGQCIEEIDLCAAIKCENGFECNENGECVPLNKPFDPCATVLCAPDEQCFNGQCYDEEFNLCSIVTCGPGTTCINGKCIKTYWADVLEELLENQALFNSFNCKKYIYSVQQSCFCFGCTLIKKFIYVKGDNDIKIEFDTNDIGCNEDNLNEWDYKTINDWFDQSIKYAKDYLFCDNEPEDSQECKYKGLDIVYDINYGYPKEIIFDEKAAPFDGAVWYNFDDFECKDNDKPKTTDSEEEDPCKSIFCGPCKYCQDGVCHELCDEFEKCDYATNQCQGSYQFCGGLGGILCDLGYECIDDPRDNCNPNCGGADCGGICVKVWDDGLGNGAECGGILNTECPDNFICFDDPFDECNPQCGGYNCKGFCADPVQSDS